MDPITFATIVGLICNYRQEKGAQEQLDHQKFIEWLQYHKHEEIKNLIVNTAVLQTDVDNLLRADHAIMMGKLDSLSTALASLSSQVMEFRGLATTMVPQAELSEQAIGILRHLVNSNCDYIVYQDRGGGHLQPNNDEPLNLKDTRFLKDDIEKLKELGLVRTEWRSDITTLLYPTRNAARLISAMGLTMEVVHEGPEEREVL